MITTNNLISNSLFKPTFVSTPHSAIKSDHWHKPREFALVIAGRNKYPGPITAYAPLQHAKSLTRIHESLKEANFHSKDISILCHSSESYSIPRNSNIKEEEVELLRPLPIKGDPIFPNIHTAIQSLEQQAQKGDRVWIYLIGHGCPGGFINNRRVEPGMWLEEKNRNPDPKLPTVLTPEALKKELDQLPPSIPIRVVADCCYSGNFATMTDANKLVVASTLGQTYATLLTTDVLSGERYATKFADNYRVSATAEQTDALAKSLLGMHIQSTDPIHSTGFDSYSYMLGKALLNRLYKINPNSCQLGIQTRAERLLPLQEASSLLPPQIQSDTCPIDEKQQESIVKIHTICQEKLIDCHKNLAYDPSDIRTRQLLSQWNYSYLDKVSGLLPKIATPEEVKPVLSVAEVMLD